jgi:hypothetical protein
MPQSEQVTTKSSGDSGCNGDSKRQDMGISAASPKLEIIHFELSGGGRYFFPKAFRIYGISLSRLQARHV